MRSVDQNTRQQIEQIVAEYRDAWNNHNAAGIATCYTNGGIAVAVTKAPQVVKNGQQEIQEELSEGVPHVPSS